ncbi:DUF1351 domain-containing protein [Pediococcus acidilactici]|uniref:DUF1351 domain-containing protein n=1 Tax=Pediococcus acidilactici TaxID=1254 RepID=UPI00137C2D93|nr:DUF1351 domain-containing protein [Pediococcus acidilactici]QHS03560.1 DUF1351 domain-containing protein [Pediococcus acidilactici]
MNELKINGETSVTYQANEIVINNYDKLESLVENAAQKYSTLVVSEETIKEAKKSRAELNKLKTAIDSKRKAVKREYMANVRDFEKMMNSLGDKITPVIDSIDEKTKELEELQRKEKAEKVQALINEMAPNYEIDPATIEIEDKWLLKSTTMKNIAEELKDGMLARKAQARQLANDIQTITKYAESKDVEPYGWVEQLKQGQDVPYLLAAIDHAVEQKEQAEREAQAQAMAEATHQKQVGDNIVDTNSGEVVSRKVILELTVTNTTAKLLANFLRKNQIDFRKVN